MQFCEQDVRGITKVKKKYKVFLKPRKRRFKNGVVNQLKIGEIEFATTNNEILNEFESFYRKIYSSKIYDQEI